MCVVRGVCSSTWSKNAGGVRAGRDGLSGFVCGGVVDAGCAEGLYALYTGGALAAVVLATFVATPCLAVVDAESVPAARISVRL